MGQSNIIVSCKIVDLGNLGDLEMVSEVMWVEGEASNPPQHSHLISLE